MQQVEETCKVPKNSKAGCSAQEKWSSSTVSRVNDRAAIPCTGCSYCMPCPNNVHTEELWPHNSGVIREYKGAKISYKRSSMKPSVPAHALAASAKKNAAGCQSAHGWRRLINVERFAEDDAEARSIL